MATEQIEWDLLAEHSAWQHHQPRNRYSLFVGPYTLHVDSLPTAVLWQVEHERFGVLQPWTMEQSPAAARHAAVAFAKFHHQGLYEPKHLEQ